MIPFRQAQSSRPFVPPQVGEAIEENVKTPAGDTLQDELRLLHRARSLNEEALAEIHDRYYTAVFRYIAFRVDDYATTEDLTSEVFMRLLSTLRERTAPRNTLRGWLFGTASNLVKDYYRKKGRRPQTAIHEHMESNVAAPDQQLEEKLKREKLHTALADLTEEQQHVLALRFGYGLPIKEVAALLDKSEGAVKMLQARATAALARLLSEDAH